MGGGSMRFWYVRYKSKLCKKHVQTIYRLARTVRPLTVVSAAFLPLTGTPLSPDVDSSRAARLKDAEAQPMLLTAIWYREGMNRCGRTWMIQRILYELYSDSEAISLCGSS